MEQLSLDEVVSAVGGTIGEFFINSTFFGILFNGVSTDSRTTKPGDLFVALIGPNFDGHSYVNDAVVKGAKGVVVKFGYNQSNVRRGYQNSETSLKTCLIHVNDTTEALGDLAGYYRRKMPARIIAVTGSNGKTTTKDMVYHLLSKKFKTIKSRASFNNFIGVPLTIFELDMSSSYGVVELGTNAFGEIHRLSEIALPDIAVITNISESHLEGLGNINGVKRAKAEILENIKSGGSLVINGDDENLIEIGRDFKRGDVVSFGVRDDVSFRASQIEKNDKGWSFIMNDKDRVKLSIPGHCNVFNCLASFAVLSLLGIEIDNPENVFDDFCPAPMRMNRETIWIQDNKHRDDDSISTDISGTGSSRLVVVNDAYNANPSSMKAAVCELDQMQCSGRKIFISGDMLELGNETKRLHLELGNEIGRHKIDLLWTVGEQALFIKEGAMSNRMEEDRINCFKTFEDLRDFALSHLLGNDVVLIKGSRLMRLERLVSEIKVYFHGECN